MYVHTAHIIKSQYLDEFHFYGLNGMTKKKKIKHNSEQLKSTLFVTSICCLLYWSIILKLICYSNDIHLHYAFAYDKIISSRINNKIIAIIMAYYLEL